MIELSAEWPRQMLSAHPFFVFKKIIIFNIFICRVKYQNENSLVSGNLLIESLIQVGFYTNQIT